MFIQWTLTTSQPCQQLYHIKQKSELFFWGVFLQLLEEEYCPYQYNIQNSLNHSIDEKMEERTSSVPASKLEQHKRINLRKVRLNKERGHQYRKAESLSRAPFLYSAPGRTYVIMHLQLLQNCDCTAGNKRAYGPKGFCHF